MAINVELFANLQKGAFVQKQAKLSDQDIANRKIVQNMITRFEALVAERTNEENVKAHGLVLKSAELLPNMIESYLFSTLFTGKSKDQDLWDSFVKSYADLGLHFKTLGVMGQTVTIKVYFE